VDFKNALAVCLISLFSATLVLLIARALDMQAASRLEPQLAQIVEELREIRKAGGMPTSTMSQAESQFAGNGLVVYYFHGNTRCPTCQSIEAQAKETVEKDFAAQLGSGEMTWKILNYEDSAVAPLAKKFEIQMPVVVLARMNGEKVEDWKRLDKVWALVGDKTAFTKYVHDEIGTMLSATPAASESLKDDPPAIPMPEGNSQDIPVPEPTSSIPVPQDK
jgi:hypothetical protein